MDVYIMKFRLRALFYDYLFAHILYCTNCKYKGIPANQFYQKKDYYGNQRKDKTVNGSVGVCEIITTMV